MVKNDVFKEKLFEETESERDRKKEKWKREKGESQVTKSIMMINSTYILLLTLFSLPFFFLLTASLLHSIRVADFFLLLSFDSHGNQRRKRKKMKFQRVFVFNVYTRTPHPNVLCSAIR